MQVELERLEIALNELKATLKDGLIASDIWDRHTGLPLLGYNTNPAAVALLTEIDKLINHHLETASMPLLGRFFFVELENHQAGLIIRHGEDLLQGILVDTNKTNIGILMAVALPKMLQRVNIPTTVDPAWRRALTGNEPKVSALATRLLLTRLRDEVRRDPAKLDAAAAQLRDFFAANAFAMRDLANL